MKSKCKRLWFLSSFLSSYSLLSLHVASLFTICSFSSRRSPFSIIPHHLFLSPLFVSSFPPSTLSSFILFFPPILHFSIPFFLFFLHPTITSFFFPFFLPSFILSFPSLPPFRSSYLCSHFLSFLFSSIHCLSFILSYLDSFPLSSSHFLSLLSPCLPLLFPSVLPSEVIMFCFICLCFRTSVLKQTNGGDPPPSFCSCLLLYSSSSLPCRLLSFSLFHLFVSFLSRLF